MKNILAIAAVLIIIGVLVWSHKKVEPTTITPITSNTESPILGCYVAQNGKDIYNLNIQNQDAQNINGTLSFKNFEKDSSKGSFNGTYKDSILFGNYAFSSEGMDSMMQVVFKKEGDNFIRGYGPVDSEGTHFTDLSKVTYEANSLSVFEKRACTVGV